MRAFIRLDNPINFVRTVAPVKTHLRVSWKPKTCVHNIAIAELLEQLVISVYNMVKMGVVISVGKRHNAFMRGTCQCHELKSHLRKHSLAFKEHITITLLYSHTGFGITGRQR